MPLPLSTALNVSDTGHVAAHIAEREVLNGLYLPPTITPGTDLSTYTTVGRVLVPSSNATLPQNAPPIGTSILTVFQIPANGAYVQDLVGIDTGITARRVDTGSGYGTWRISDPSASARTDVRNLAGVLVNGWAGEARLIRAGYHVQLTLRTLAGGTADLAYTLPAPFRPASTITTVAALNNNPATLVQVSVTTAGEVLLPTGSVLGSKGVALSWITTATMPGPTNWPGTTA